MSKENKKVYKVWVKRESDGVYVQTDVIVTDDNKKQEQGE